MTGTPVKIAACLSLAMFLTACGSSPTSQFYRLTPGNGSLGSEQQPSLGVGPVEIPEFLNRTALVYTRGENRLLISGTELWAEPLADGVNRVLGLNLAQLLNTQSLSYFPWDTRHPPEYGVRISIIDLDANEQQATLVADWVLFHPTTGKAINRRISRYTSPLPAGAFDPSELPLAYSALLYQLSETIAGSIEADQQKTASDSGEH
jgi:uncharacterized lipoprotein YmbA